VVTEYPSQSGDSNSGGVLAAAGCPSPSAGLRCPPGAPCPEGVPFRVSFQLRWVVPVRARAGTGLYVAAVWASRQPPTFSTGQNLAKLVLS
jgi:hypothetical protein